MDISCLKDIPESKKFYATISLKEHPEVFINKLEYEGNEYHISDELMEELSVNSGVPRKLSRILKNKDSSLWNSTVLTMCDYYYKGSLTLFIEDTEVTNVLFTENPPLINTEFLQEAYSTLEDYESILNIESFEYNRNSYQSSLTVFKNETFTYKNTEYRLGVMFINDELSVTYCRLVVEVVDESVFYLPAKSFNLTSSRYMKSSKNRVEALQQLILRVVEMIDSEDWFSIIPDIDNHLYECSKTEVTYEEYKNTLNLLNRISIQSDLDEDTTKSLREELDETFIDFDQNYPMISEKKGSYIWRCSALSDRVIFDLIHHMNSWVDSGIFYPESVFEIRSFVGEFVMLDKIVKNLARRKI